MRRLWFWIAVVLAASATVALLFLWRASPAGNPVVINNTAVPPVPTLASARVTSGAALYAQN